MYDKIHYKLKKKKKRKKKFSHALTDANYMKQKLTELMVEIDSSSIVAEDFNTLLPIMDRTTKQKIKK